MTSLPVQSPDLTDEDRARIAARYPAQPALHRAVVVATIVFAVVGLAWTIWAGMHHASPPVTADVFGFRVVSETETDADLRVQRSDPSRAAICTVQAQGADFVRVGELQARIEPSSEKVTRVTVRVKTMAKATTATVAGCRAA